MQKNSTHFPNSEPHIFYDPDEPSTIPFDVLIRILLGKWGR